MELTRARNVIAAALPLWTLLLACSPPSPSPSPSGTSENTVAFTPIVEFDGCTQLYSDARCALQSGAALDLWIGVDDPTELVLTLGTRRVDLATQSIARDGGRLVRLEPAALPTTLRLRRTATDSAVLFQLSIDRLPEYALDAEVQALVDRGDTAAAIARLRAALIERPEYEHGLILSRLARAQTRANDWTQADADFLAAIRAHEAVGRVSAAVSDRSALSFHYLNRGGDLAAAARLLDGAPVLIAGDARSRTQLDSRRGFAARLAGDLTVAEHFYSEAMQRAHRFGDSQREAVARTGLAQTWAEIGDFTRAVETLTAISDSAMQQLTVCDRARLHNTRAWTLLLALEAGTALGDPLPDLEAARSLLNTQCAFLGNDRSNVEVNRALAHVQRGDTQGARAALTAAHALNVPLPANQSAWILEIEARIALAEGDARAALAAYRALDKRAGALLLFDAQWRAALGAAEAERKLGQTDAAIEDLQRADILLGDYVRELPALEWRALFLARYESLPKHLVEALLDRGRVEEAWLVARRYRNEPLRQVQRLARIGALDPEAQAQWRDVMSRYQQLRMRLDDAAAQDWQLSAQQLDATHAAREVSRLELRALVARAAALGSESDAVPDMSISPNDELSLLYFPLTRGWAAFSFDQSGLRATRIGALDLSAESVELSGELLEPFRVELLRATKLRVMAYGPLLDLDFHRLLWNGQPLGASMRVVYAADLPLIITDTRPEHVLLVADPAGNLPAARDEIAHIERTLRQHKPDVLIERLQGQSASAAAISDALTRATVFHYAGHTARSEDADANIGFALAEGQRLELGDILMLKHAPSVAVLAACDSALSVARTPAQALSLAHAFLARGSQQVIATTRPVDDFESAKLTAALHRLRAEGMPIDQALGEAQRHLLLAQPDSDWSAFRMYTR